MNKMYSELKEKMQKAAVELQNEFNGKYGKGSNLIARDVSNRIKETFEEGATAMYACLAPLVEWVSVEERLPEERTIVLVKTFCNKYYDGYLLDGRWVIDKQYFLGKITYWRKMEL